MAIERLLNSVGPVAFTANGGTDGTVTVASVEGFKVKQLVVISAISLPTLTLEVKRVVSLTKLLVGPVVTTGKMLARQDLSAYTTALSASVSADEQNKAKIPPNDIIQAVYEQEPTVAIRTVGVDILGRPYTATNPLPVSASVSIPALDVALTHLNDSPNPGDIADSVRIGDGVEELAINPDGSINSIKQNALVVTKFDDIVITRNSRNQAMLIEYKKLGVTTATATITRNAAGSIIRVLRTPSV